MRKEQITIVVEPTIIEKLAVMTEEEGRSRSALINDLLKKALGLKKTAKKLLKRSNA